VLGLETEYALLFAPEVGSPAPVHEKLYEALTEALRQECLCLEAAYRKGGHFLANGGLVHYEAEPAAPHRGLLEIATPECATVREAVASHRGLERLIVRLLPSVRRRLGDAGHAGQLVLGKASSDYQGRTFGTHENYSVTDRPDAVRWIALACFVAIFQLVRLPITLLALALAAAHLALTAALLAGSVVVLYVASRDGRAPARSDPGARGGDSPPLPRAWTVVRAAAETLRAWAARVRDLDRRVLVPPASRIAGHLVLARFRRHLVPFLVTRVVFTGPGWLRTDRRASPGVLAGAVGAVPGRGTRFVLSARAAATGSVMQALGDPSAKPIIDIKNLFAGAFTLFARTKRLHVSYSDSNMSEYALWLKLATTELVVRMLEDGHAPDEAAVALADPLAAVEIVSSDLTLTRSLARPDRPRLTALDVQRAYLDAARSWVQRRHPESEEHARVLDQWQDVLDRLASNPRSLADRLDWVAKRDLMDEAVGSTGWEAVAAALPAIRFLEERGMGLGRVIDRPTEVRAFMLARLGPEDGGSLSAILESSGIDWEELPVLYRLHYQLKKIDLKYHELSESGGYHAQMERERLFVRVLDDAELAMAETHPPCGTRAALRAHYVREASRHGLEVLAGWDHIIVPARYAVIALPDPCAAGPAIDLSALASEGGLRTALRFALFLPRLGLPA
jgi:proteasome accessory factor A